MQFNRTKSTDGTNTPVYHRTSVERGGAYTPTEVEFQLGFFSDHLERTTTVAALPAGRCSQAVDISNNN